MSWTWFPFGPLTGRGTHRLTLGEQFVAGGVSAKEYNFLQFQEIYFSFVGITYLLTALSSLCRERVLPRSRTATRSNINRRMAKELITTKATLFFTELKNPA